MSKTQEVVEFLHAVQQRFESFCQSCNQRAPLEKKAWSSPLGPIDVAISRGEVLEKASAIFCDLRIDTPPVLAQKMGWQGATMQSLVLEIGIHPVNPHIPKGYIELRANIVDSVILAGGTDIFPYLPEPGDVELFASQIRAACTQHGQNYELLRRVRADFFKSKHSKQSVGSHAGIYSFHLEEDQFVFFQAMAEVFFNAYGELVATRKDEPYTQADTAHKHRLHGQWAQWIMVEDEGTRFGLEKGIPPEALLGAILPPVATF